MSKKKLWMISSLSLVLITMASSVFSIVYSATLSSETSNIYYFNFLSTKQTGKNVVTTSLNNTDVAGLTTMQIMKIADKFVFNPTNSVSTEQLSFGYNLEAGATILNEKTHNFVLIPIKITNNMIDFAKATIRFENLNGSSLLKEISYYEIYDYSKQSLSGAKLLTESSVVSSNLIRGESLDLLIAVYVSAEDFDLESSTETLYFNVYADLVRNAE